MFCRRFNHAGLTFALFFVANLFADDSLHHQIDQLLSGIRVGPETPVCSDAEFLRRVYLDLTGVIPTSDEARTFLDDKSSNKRVALVDQLLASPDYARHMAKVFDVMLMERRPDKYVKANEWQTYLLASFQANKPYNELAREVLGADGDQRGPAKFYLEREVEPNLLTREVGRAFFGIDLQCAQCHDHPIIDDYLQSDYHGLYAFVSRTTLFQPDKKKPALLAEKAEGEVKFKSVFTGDEGVTGPRLPGGVQIVEPLFAKDYAYKVKPDKNVRSLPHFSRREVLAKQAAEDSNLAFNRNIGNRLWAHMMGRGLVHPVDMHHSDNPPAHPELLDMLASKFAADKYDIKIFLRELALSNAYQRSVQIPDTLATNGTIARESLTALQQKLQEAEQAIEPTKQAAVAADVELEASRKSVLPIADEAKKANDAWAAVQKVADAASRALADAEKQLADKQAFVKAFQEAAGATDRAAKLTKDNEVANVVKVLQAREQKFAGEVPALTKAITEKKAAADAAVQKAAEPKAAADAANAKYLEAETNRAAVEQKAVAAELALKAAYTRVEHLSKQIELTKTIVEFSDAQQRVTALTATKVKLDGDLVAANQSVQKLTDELGGLTNQRSELAKQHSSAQSALANATTAIGAKKELAASVSDSYLKSKAIADKLPKDKELVDAVAKLKQRSDQYASEIAAMEKTLPPLQSAEKSAAEALASLDSKIGELKGRSDAAKQMAAQAKQKIDEHATQLATAREQLDRLYANVTDVYLKQFGAAVLQPLSPEQLAWSTLRASGQFDRQRAAAKAEIDKKTPLKPEEQNNPEKIAERQKQVEQQTRAKLKPTIDKFVKLFGSAAGQPQDTFFATVDQALFFRNGGELRSWLNPSGENLTARLIKMEDAAALAEELYITVLSRRPSEKESQDVIQYLAARPEEKTVCVQELAWALLTSNEFRFHH